MLKAMSNLGITGALDATQVTRSGAGNDHVGLFRLPVFEYPGPLEYKRAGLSTNPANDAFKADKSGRSIASIHHEVFNPPLAFKVAGECPGDAGSRQPGLVVALTVRLLLPTLNRKTGLRGPCFIVPSAGLERQHERQARASWRRWPTTRKIARFIGPPENGPTSLASPCYHVANGYYHAPPDLRQGLCASANFALF